MVVLLIARYESLDIHFCFQVFESASSHQFLVTVHLLKIDCNRFHGNLIRLKRHKVALVLFSPIACTSGLMADFS